MEKMLLNAAFILAVTLLGGYDGFFNPDTDVTLDNEDYISEESKMYSGYIGIVTKIQAVEDKVIYLNEFRGEMMMPTATAPTGLYNLYNYDDDLSDSSYADPSGFHEVINTCNDYLRKLETYEEKNSINKSHYEALVSSTLCVEAWMFMTIAEICGEVAWVDRLMTSLRDLSQFDILNLDEAVVACKNLLDIGYDNTDGTYETAWRDWVDPDTELVNNKYRHWGMATTPYYALYVEICLWLGRYQQCINLVFNKMNSIYQSITNRSIASLRNDILFSRYTNFLSNETPYDYESVSVVMYDRQSRQTDSLLKHFNSDYPNKYWLASAKIVIERLRDNDFGPLGSKDKDFRVGYTVSECDGKWIINKFRPASKPVRITYRDDVFVYTYRGASLYFMLAEAFDQLGRRSVVDILVNIGVDAYSSEFNIDEEGTYSGNRCGITPHWTSNSTVYYYSNGTTGIGSREYDDGGIRGVEASHSNLGTHTFTSDVQDSDEEILKEMMLGMACGGKVYPAMVRMAKRYNDNSFMTKHISEKYETIGNAEDIRSKIMNGDYFIKWNLE